MSGSATFWYKCRLCGGEGHGPATGEKYALMHLIRAINGDPGNGIPLTLLSIHTCPDGSNGVSDLIGYRLDAPAAGGGR